MRQQQELRDIATKVARRMLQDKENVWDWLEIQEETRSLVDDDVDEILRLVSGAQVIVGQ